MKVLIVEDELPAAEKLERYLLKYDPSSKVIATVDSVAKSVEWLSANQDTIDLIFMDIQLLDGLSFQIFQKVNVRKPVIFTTAFNEFALDAFKVNSIDYLLKPISNEDLARDGFIFVAIPPQPGADPAPGIESPVRKVEYGYTFMTRGHIDSVWNQPPWAVLGVFEGTVDGLQDVVVLRKNIP